MKIEKVRDSLKREYPQFIPRFTIISAFVNMEIIFNKHQPQNSMHFKIIANHHH